MLGKKSVDICILKIHILLQMLIPAQKTLLIAREALASRPFGLFSLCLTRETVRMDFLSLP